MIDRQALKTTARQRMRGRKPNAYFVSAVYIAAAGVLLALVYALTQYDRFALYVENLLSVNPYPTAEELAAALPSVRPAAVVLIASVVTVKGLMDVGYMAYCLKVSRNEDAGTETIFNGFPMFFKIIRLELLQILFVGVWSLLLIFPGFIAYYSYRQAFYILLDKPELPPLDCIRESKRLMTGRRLELFFLDLSFIGWHFIDRFVEYIATLRLFSVWLAPYIGVTRAGFYDRLVSGGASSPEPG